jgi:hypothetical protein
VASSSSSSKIFSWQSCGACAVQSKKSWLDETLPQLPINTYTAAVAACKCCEKHKTCIKYAEQDARYKHEGQANAKSLQRFQLQA